MALLRSHDGNSHEKMLFTDKFANYT